MSKIIEAARFAAERHKGQKRKYNGLPYILHPCRVAGRVAIHPLADEDAVCAAYLHDVVEDCGVSLYEIRARFGLNVAAMVCELTNPSKGSDRPRAERKAMDRQHAQHLSPICKVIKLIDRIDNLREIDPADDFAKLYCQESRELLKVIEDGDESLAWELAKVIGAVELANANSHMGTIHA